MIIKFFFKMFLFVTVARWIYAETALVAPSTLPFVNTILKVAQIPTHNNWPKVDWTELAEKIDTNWTKYVDPNDRFSMRLKDDNLVQ